MILRVCDLCAKRHVEYYRVNIMIRRNDVPARNPYGDQYPTVAERDAYRLDNDGRAEVYLEVCYECAGLEEDNVLDKQQIRNEVKSRKSL